MANNKVPEGELRTLRSPCWRGEDGGDIAQRDGTFDPYGGLSGRRVWVFFDDAAPRRGCSSPRTHPSGPQTAALRPRGHGHSEDAARRWKKAAAAAATRAAPQERRKTTTTTAAAAATTTPAFSLRREDGPLRTVAPPGSGRDVYRKAKRVCAAVAPGCDHVLLMARDEWYGGLGDEVAIFTASPSSGALALRHELGHILADIGEEYDGGSDYSGPNFSESTRLCRANEQPRRVQTVDGVRQVWPCISWGAWLTTPPEEDGSSSSSIGGSSVGSNKNSNAQVDRFVGSRGAVGVHGAGRLALRGAVRRESRRGVRRPRQQGCPAPRSTFPWPVFRRRSETGVKAASASGTLRRARSGASSSPSAKIRAASSSSSKWRCPRSPPSTGIFYAFTVGPLGSGGLARRRHSPCE